MARPTVSETTRDERHQSTGKRRSFNLPGVRAYNERLVLTLVRQNGALTKAEVARMTGLSAQAISVIMRGLEADGLLEKNKPNRGRIGQPSIPMSLGCEGAYFLGLKIGRRSLEMVLVNFCGQVLDRIFHPQKAPSPDGAVRFANDAVSKLLARSGPDVGRKIAGMGIAMPFQLWVWAETLGADPTVMNQWRDFDIAADIGGHWDFPVYVQNDASAACSAELVFGKQPKPVDFLYFFVGFFIGGGLVLDNRVVTGRSGNAAALGSMSVRLKKGEPAQLVEIASLSSLDSAMVAAGHPGIMTFDWPSQWQVPHSVADPWVEHAAAGLAQVINAACCLHDLDTVIIDGWLPTSLRAGLVSRTGSELSGLEWAGINCPDVLEGTIGSEARSLGAASLPLSDCFLLDRAPSAGASR